jgi:hypothetical protein
VVIARLEGLDFCVVSPVDETVLVVDSECFALLAGQILELLQGHHDAASAGLVPLDGFHESSGIGGRPQQVDRLLPGVEVLSRHEYGVATLGVDPHREMVVVDLMDEREQARTRLASADRHGEALLPMVRYYGTIAELTSGTSAVSGRCPRT